MKAKALSRRYINTMRPPTRRKVLNAARKHGLEDSYGELHWFLASYLSQADLRQFLAPEDARQCTRKCAI